MALFAAPATAQEGPTAATGKALAIPFVTPCESVPAKQFNRLLTKRLSVQRQLDTLNGRQKTKKTFKYRRQSVCAASWRKLLRSTQAKRKQLVTLRRQCGGSCYWMLQWNKLSAADKSWAINTGRCESGNNPRISNGNGFHGEHQWVLSTWHAAGGSGNPINASQYEQRVRAVRWRNVAGRGQWPVCG